MTGVWRGRSPAPATLREGREFPRNLFRALGSQRLLLREEVSERPGVSGSRGTRESGEVKARTMRDPRYAQITVLTSLALWGAFILDFGLEASRILLILGTALGVQAFGNAARGERIDPRSALISGLSLVLLLRASDPLWGIAAALIAVGSKFLIRARGRHVFNPTNLALVVLLVLTDSVWVSSGQWGSGAVAVAACVAAACWVLPSVRGDVTIAFMTVWCALLFGRAIWLGDPLAIPLHQLSSGTLFVFAAFMLSDPRTIPNSRPGRILFASIVALAGYVGRFEYFEPNALLFSLAGAALLVPVIDGLLPGEEFRWARTQQPKNLSRMNGSEDWKGYGHDDDPRQPERNPNTPSEARGPSARGAVRPALQHAAALAGTRSRLLRLLRCQGGHETLQ